jgi:hypothetical protein
LRNFEFLFVKFCDDEYIACTVGNVQEEASRAVAELFGHDVCHLKLNLRHLFG